MSSDNHLDQEVNKKKLYPSLVVIVSIVAIHAFRLGSYLQREAYILYSSYASDILIPIFIYFLLVMTEQKINWLKPWWAKASIVFFGCAISELLQLFGFYALGVTFDLWDFVMFGLGCALAVVIDRFIFAKVIPSWQ